MDSDAGADTDSGTEIDVVTVDEVIERKILNFTELESQPGSSADSFLRRCKRKFECIYTSCADDAAQKNAIKIRCVALESKIETIQELWKHRNETDICDLDMDVDVGPTETMPPQDHHVFTIELVMLEILKQIPTDHLIQCRRVNSYFNKFANIVLRGRSCEGNHNALLTIKFRFDWQKKEYFKQREGSKLNTCETSAIASAATLDENGENVVKLDLDHPLKSLTNFLKLQMFAGNNTNFLFTSFDFTAGTSCSEDLQEFLNTFGPLLKKLKMELFCPPQASFLQPAASSSFYPNVICYCSIKTCPEGVKLIPTVGLLKKLLLHQVTNLETLVLTKYPPNWDNSQTPSVILNSICAGTSDGIQFDLPKLKRASLRLPQEITEEILSASPNLEELQDCRNTELLFLLKSNKFHVIKSLLWVPNLQDFDQCNELLQTMQPRPHVPTRLTKFQLSLGFAADDPVFFKKMTKVLASFLQACSRSLLIFCLWSSLGFLNELVFPEMPKVQTLNIGDTTFPPHFKITAGITKKLFPPRFQIAFVFPHLQSITFALDHLLKYDRWESYFDENIVPAFTVKKVVLDKTLYFPMGWMSKLFELFPNAEEITIKTMCFNYMDAARNGLWRFEKLKVLNCNISLSLPENYEPNLDCAFTGLSRVGHEKLKEISTGDVDLALETVQGYREFPSIVDLKELRNLNLTFIDESKSVWAHYLSKMTQITGQFAFDMCPQLKVKGMYRLGLPENIIPFKAAVGSVYPYIDWSDI